MFKIYFAFERETLVISLVKAWHMRSVDEINDRNYKLKVYEAKKTLK